jgi:hypothetical protein
MMKLVFRRREELPATSRQGVMSARTRHSGRYLLGTSIHDDLETVLRLVTLTNLFDEISIGYNGRLHEVFPTNWRKASKKSSRAPELWSLDQPDRSQSMQL